MKKVIFTWLLFSGAIGFSQCPIGGLSLTTQADVDNFPILYPTCTTVDGLYITGSDIDDLTPLNGIETITGFLEISNTTNLSSLDGLENLTSISTDLFIIQNEALIDISALSGITTLSDGQLLITDNESLTNLNGLQNISFIASNIQIANNALMTNLDGLAGLTTQGAPGISSSTFFAIGQMPNLTDISGLSNLTTVEGAFTLSEMPNLISLNGLEGITNLKYLVLNDLGIIDFYGLQNLTSVAFVSGGSGFFIEDNQNLTSLNGLQNLNDVSGILSLVDNPDLTNLDALNHSMTIGDLTITGNTSLSQCAALGICEYLDVNSATISSNASGCNSEAEVESICAVPQTKLNNTWCGAQLTLFSTNFYAVAVTGATQYEFEFTDTVSNVVTTNLRTVNYTNLQIAGLMYLSKTYNVRVRAYVSGVWGAYGQICLLDAPATVPTTSLNGTFCNSQLTTFSQNIQAITVAGATQYEFKFTDTSTSVATYDVKSISYTTLQNAGLMTLGSVYDVEVRAYVDGTWGSFGSVCQLDAPATVPTTALKSTFCNTQLTTFSQNFYAISVAGATQYEFKFTDTSTSVVTYDVKSVSYTTLQNAGLITLGSTYSVEVRAYVDGTWGSFGSVCLLDAPATVPPTALNSTYCGASIVSFTQNIHAITVAGATQYKFEFKDVSTGTIYTHDRSVNYTTLTVAGLTSIGKTYEVRVKAYLDGTWGSYGTMCMLTGPTSMILYNDGSDEATGSEISTEAVSLDEQTMTEISIYPNPASEYITLSTDLTSYSYQVYASSGQLVASEEQVTGTITVDVSYLHNGLYSVVILNSDQQFVGSKQVVINR